MPKAARLSASQPRATVDGRAGAGSGEVAAGAHQAARGAEAGVPGRAGAVRRGGHDRADRGDLVGRGGQGLLSRCGCRPRGRRRGRTAAGRRWWLRRAGSAGSLPIQPAPHLRRAGDGYAVISAQIPPRDGSGGALTSGCQAVQRAVVSEVTFSVGGGAPAGCDGTEPRVAPPIGRRVGSGAGVAHRVRHRHPCQLLRPVHRRGPPRGFRHQEAPQADGQEEAPQAAEEDTRPAS